ncbi:hypothetical protein KUM39_11505 [Streptomyces sp. J2-1]|uniref:hypothetical protein n=1 Tax=Streptomyces corallincola TaxID=2851888 RepID=UPI001C386079|nr:hypothetical protein [Streptomyces corallincola]MBV2354983.1 hypothetical protein [Streptomyces corallincola]
MRELIRAVSAAAVAVLVLVALSGCSREYEEKRGKADAPVAGRAGEDSPAEIYNFPDGFGNLASKCVGPGRRGYVTTKYVRQDDDDTIVMPSTSVIVDDPECRAAP